MQTDHICDLCLLMYLCVSVHLVGDGGGQPGLSPLVLMQSYGLLHHLVSQTTHRLVLEGTSNNILVGGYQ